MAAFTVSFMILYSKIFVALDDKNNGCVEKQQQLGTKYLCIIA